MWGVGTLSMHVCTTAYTTTLYTPTPYTPIPPPPIWAMGWEVEAGLRYCEYPMHYLYVVCVHAGTTLCVRCVH